MMQRLVDSALGVAKESIKTFSQESFTNFVKLVNGFSALVLAVLPGKTSALEAVTGWEQYPTFRAPRLPRWMEEGVSSFNQYIHDFDLESTDSDTESEYATDVDDDDGGQPPSPCSHTSRTSKASSFSRTGSVRRGSSLWRRWFRRMTWPVRFVLRKLHISGRFQSGHHTPSSSGSVRPEPGTLRRNGSGSGSGSFKDMMKMASKRFIDVKELVVNHRTTDSRRRGVVEDLQLGVELFIERVFDFVRKWIHYCLSPFETFKAVARRIFSGRQTAESGGDETVIVQTATLGDSEEETKKSERRYNLRLNTDARTCGDFITAMGYPYESLKVTTSDCYILSLERIPRPESKHVLYLQHGILDSSLGWVSCGVVGSQAFAAYDQGYDVFLGNFRGLASRDHVDKHISSQGYWKYSVNEHGTQDIPAMLNKVHELKMTELKELNLLDDESLGPSEPGSAEKVPYSLCGVSHSLGGAAMLIYLVTRRLQGRPHYMERAILLSPAGFHQNAPFLCSALQYLLPAMAPVLRPIVPGMYIPTKFFRMLFNKLSRDFQNYPALGGLVQTLISYCLGGDSSNWIGAFGMTHYNMEDMPGIAYGVGLHLGQMMRTKKFMMFNYGSPARNMQAYGTPEPLDVGANYGLIDIPVDVVAGKKDKLIPKSMVAKHYQVLSAAGVKSSYSEFEYAHLDFTFSNRDEVLDYVMSRLLLVGPESNSTSTQQFRRKLRKAKTVRERKRRGWEKRLEEFKQSPEFSHSRSKSFVLRKTLVDGEIPPEEEQSDSGGSQRDAITAGDSDDGVEQDVGKAEITPTSEEPSVPETKEDDITAARLALENKSSRKFFNLPRLRIPSSRTRS